jgi:hypothetical protein
VALWLYAGRRRRRLEFFVQEHPALLPWRSSPGITPNSRPPEFPAGLLPPPQRSSAPAMAIGFALKVRVGSMGNLNSVPMRR